LFEAGLQAGWNPEAEDGTYNVQDLLAIYTGVAVKNVAPDDYYCELPLIHSVQADSFLKMAKLSITCNPPLFSSIRKVNPLIPF